MTVEEIGRVCHEVNRAYCLSLGDHSQAVWEEAPEWQKESVIRGVRFHVDHPEVGPEASHEEWLRVKKDKGWTFGEEKDSDLKTHPCMRTFESLPREQQAKDFIFRALVHSLLS